MNYSIGIDIGGTKTAIAVVRKDGQIIQDTKIPTDLSISPEAMIRKISNEVEELIEKSSVLIADITGIGIGAPGPLDSKNGMITCPPNLKTWTDIPIIHLMKEKWTVPIMLENDANAAALAEKWLGAARGVNNFIYMTVSTGIGAGIITDGKLLHGVKGNAGDIGHTVIDPSFGRCNCGQFGCLESIASGMAIAKRASKMLAKSLSTKEVFDLYYQGNPEIIAFIDRIFHVLGVASVTLINTFDPEKIVIGGGVSKVGKPMFDAIQDYVHNFALNSTGRKTEITPAQLGEHAGVVGAACLCFEGSDEDVPELLSIDD